MDLQRVRATYKIKSGRKRGPRGVQGDNGNNGSIGDSGVIVGGDLGDIGNPGGTCACRLDMDVNDVSATGASSGDLLLYDSGDAGGRFGLVSSVGLDVSLIDFSTVPVFDSSTGAADALGERFQLYRLADESHLIRMVFNERTMLTKWVTSNTSGGSSSSNQISLPLVSGGDYDMLVYWGDGTTDRITAFDDAEATHTYASSGTYDVAIFGKCQGWRFASAPYSLSGDRNKLIEVSQWGSGFWLNGPSSSQNSNFGGCDNIVFTATDAPNLSNTTDMNFCFGLCPNFNSDLSSWNTSNVMNMDQVFADGGSFNHPGINEWDTSNVTSMNTMFLGQAFNQDLDNWDVSNVTSMNEIFDSTPFSGNVSTWDVSKVKFFLGAFARGSQNPLGITGWNVSEALDLDGMFQDNGTFNQDLGNWNVSNVTNFSNMFNNCGSFNQDLSNWTFATGAGVSISMVGMFQSSGFNNGGSTGINNWNTSRVTSMRNMFFGNGSFDQDIGDWDVSSCTQFANMFRGGVFNSNCNWTTMYTGPSTIDCDFMFGSNNSFNQPLDNWNTGRIINATNMFVEMAAFNQDLGTWDMSGLATANYMFAGSASYEGKGLKNWDVSNVNSFVGVFENCASFNADLGNSGSTGGSPTGPGWNIESATNMTDFFASTTCPTGFYDSALIHWANLPNTPSNITFNGGNSEYTVPDGSDARSTLKNVYNWTITDGGTGL